MGYMGSCYNDYNVTKAKFHLLKGDYIVCAMCKIAWPDHPFVPLSWTLLPHNDTQANGDPFPDPSISRPRIKGLGLFVWQDVAQMRQNRMEKGKRHSKEDASGMM